SFPTTSRSRPATPSCARAPRKDSLLRLALAADGLLLGAAVGEGGGGGGVSVGAGGDERGGDRGLAGVVDQALGRVGVGPLVAVLARAVAGIEAVVLLAPQLDHEFPLFLARELGAVGQHDLGELVFQENDLHLGGLVGLERL